MDELQILGGDMALLALPQKDTKDKHRKNIKKYWWIPKP